jgi:hypothetical protein
MFLLHKLFLTALVHSLANKNEKYRQFFTFTLYYKELDKENHRRYS